MSIKKIKVIGVGFESDYQTAEKEQPTWDDVSKAIRMAREGYNSGKLKFSEEEILEKLKQDRG